MSTATEPQVTVTKTTPATKSRPSVYVVHRGTDPIGLLTKFKNTRTETHPWKAYGDTGDITFIGAFYEERSLLADDRNMVYGGRDAALQAVLDHNSRKGA